MSAPRGRGAAGTGGKAPSAIHVRIDSSWRALSSTCPVMLRTRLRRSLEDRRDDGLTLLHPSQVHRRSHYNVVDEFEYWQMEASSDVAWVLRLRSRSAITPPCAGCTG
jgi:hypothetical protein